MRLLGISKRGDKYLRTLLIHGARRTDAQQITTRVGNCIGEASAKECGRRSDGEQDGTHDLGADGP